MKSLPRGPRARLGLVLARSYRAELLILDEPSSGLDPLVRRDILRAIIEGIADEGRHGRGAAGPATEPRAIAVRT